MRPLRSNRSVDPKRGRKIAWLLATAAAALFTYVVWRELGVLAILILGGVSGIGLWSTRDPKPRSDENEPRDAAKPEASSSRVQSTNSNGTLSVEIALDVPWPAGARPEVNAQLHARMRELKAASASSKDSKEISGFHGSKAARAMVSSVRASLTLTAHEDAVIEEARIELRSRIGSSAAYTLARAQRLSSGDHARLSGQWTAPPELTRVCIAITLSDGRHWSHELGV